MRFGEDGREERYDVEFTEDEGPEDDDDPDFLDELLDNLRDREAGMMPYVWSSTAVIRFEEENPRPEDEDISEEGAKSALEKANDAVASLFTPEAQEKRANAWKAYYEKIGEDARRKSQDEEGWGEEQVEVEELSMGAATMPLCPACGWTITLCDVHDEDELEVIRMHEAGYHEACDPEGCHDALAALDSDLEHLYGGEVDPNLHFDA